MNKPVEALYIDVPNICMRVPCVGICLSSIGYSLSICAYI